MIFPWQKIIINSEKLKKIKATDIAKNVLIEPNVHISGKVIIGSGTILKSGTYIEGPVIIGKNCTLGPNCYLRSATNLGDQVKIGQAVEIKNSLIGSHTNVAHLSYIGDSVIGNFVNIGAGTITANLRHDGKSVKVKWGKNLIDTELRKFGCFIGDYSKTAIHTSIYPGLIIAAYVFTLPGEIVTKNQSCFSFGGVKLTQQKIKKLWPKIDQKIATEYKNI